MSIGNKEAAILSRFPKARSTFWLDRAGCVPVSPIWCGRQAEPQTDALKMLVYKTPALMTLKYAAPNLCIYLCVCFNRLPPSTRMKVPREQALSVLGTAVYLAPRTIPGSVYICRLTDKLSGEKT